MDEPVTPRGQSIPQHNPDPPPPPKKSGQKRIQVLTRKQAVHVLCMLILPLRNSQDRFKPGELPERSGFYSLARVHLFGVWILRHIPSCWEKQSREGSRSKAMRLWGIEECRKSSCSASFPAWKQLDSSHASSIYLSCSRHSIPGIFRVARKHDFIVDYRLPEGECDSTACKREIDLRD